MIPTLKTFFSVKPFVVPLVAPVILAISSRFETWIGLDIGRNGGCGKNVTVSGLVLAFKKTRLWKNKIGIVGGLPLAVFEQ
jgi:hypothetical protein